MTPIDSLDAYLDFMVKHNIDDAKIYSHFAQIDVQRLGMLLRRLERVEDARPPRGRRATSFRAKQSNLKGRIYEQLVETLVSGVRCFETWTRVGSSTNELDILVVLGPSAKHVPAMRSWDTHCICECKYHSTYVQNDWVSKFNTVLQTHGAHVGLLFSRKGIASAGNGVKIRTLLQMLANSASPTFIMSIDWNDLLECAGGKNFLQLISERFVEIRVGSRKFGLVASP